MKCVNCKWYKSNRKDGKDDHCNFPNEKWKASEAIWDSHNRLIGCPYGEV